MYAVFRTGGKQYRAAKGDVLRLEKIEADEGATITFDEVLLIGEGADVKVGDPLLSGSSVSGKVLSQGKTKKVNVVKFKRRQNYLRQGSHRQFYTEVEITGISGSGAKKGSQEGGCQKGHVKENQQEEDRRQENRGEKEGCKEDFLTGQVRINGT
jgi:large subunit ribosomal protein L21